MGHALCLRDSYPLLTLSLALGLGLASVHHADPLPCGDGWVLRVVRCVPHSHPPPRKNRVLGVYGFLISSLSYFGNAVASLPTLVGGLFFAYTAQHGYGDAND